MSLRQGACGCTGLLAIGASIIAGCLRSASVPVEISFVARIGDAPFSCAGADASAGFQPSDLRLYVHDVELVDANGTAVPVALTRDAAFQNGTVALLDFEDGTGNCANGTAGTHTSILGRVPPGDYRALRFTLGVPFALNHADPAAADPPLTLGRMHWGWQGGYKFLRFEGLDAAGHGVSFHLGSTGCEGTIGHIQRCARPNRPTIELAGFTPQRSTVVVQLATLLAGLDGTRAHNCMADVDAADCAPLFAAVGLDASHMQRLFQLSGS